MPVSIQLAWVARKPQNGHENEAKMAQNGAKMAQNGAKMAETFNSRYCLLVSSRLAWVTTKPGKWAKLFHSKLQYCSQLVKQTKHSIFSQNIFIFSFFLLNFFTKYFIFSQFLFYFWDLRGFSFLFWIRLAVFSTEFVAATNKVHFLRMP